VITTGLELSATLGLAVAEGLETTHQADVLRQLGCRSAQGYLFSAPVLSDDLLRSPGLARGAGAA
jgi:EAL domain-containing protein (putative c-di-GMP-specific phosphodiesterase class I)